ncbi:hypothetical protein [Streptomyces sp. NPDC049040]|uniref:hypothetical protein n=1 Tax=Streptomyces sp. NPDC049040 TaxID=3365593 RepID=UPI00371B1A44
MTDERGSDLPGDLLSSTGDPGSGTTAVRKARPWLWTVGGIVLTSAVWATIMQGTGSTAPDLHGYHLSGNPCSGAALNPLKSAVGTRSFAASNATVSKGPALDRLSCVLTTASRAGDGWATTYTISVSIDLHKKTDPRAEFENSRDAQVSSLPGGGAGDSPMIAVADSGFTSAADVHPVTGVGDEGYLLTPRGPGQTLEVLHGGAILTLQITGYTEWNGPDQPATDAGDPPKEPDLTHLRPAMTTAMRHLMTSLAF